MQITDPIADMLTRIRNANSSKHESVNVPASKIKIEIAKILDAEGYINGFEIIEDKVQSTIKVNLKYGPGKQKVITGLKRVSKPGLRVYASNENFTANIELSCFFIGHDTFRSRNDSDTEAF